MKQSVLVVGISGEMRWAFLSPALKPIFHGESAMKTDRRASTNNGEPHGPQRPINPMKRTTTAKAASSSTCSSAAGLA
ncbi:hypothetical protein V7S43_009767 [Phytophthora oleae]|uniref:Uncharacterized protein n=1 Tax=Phytophthora oleae TaxID=2107226 RepID=A0ABD3FH02_9STRA